MNCPHCHAQLIPDARFCPACGKAISPTESGASWPAAGGAPDLVGREIAGRYRIITKLGEGGMGAVYRAEQISLKRSVAVKLLRPELSANQMILRRFNAEAEAVAKLSHPNIVNIYDFGQDRDGTLFIAMEYIEGRSLREAIQKQGPFSPRRALAIALQVAASLVDAHAHSIVHRDLKPDNVMLQDRGKQQDIVRVLDFGIAKLRDDSRATQAMTQAGDLLGTPQYMAPEQIRGEAIDGRTDIYALGCMIYEMVTARLPHEAPTIMAMLSKHLVEQPVPPTQRRPDLQLPPAIDQLVGHAMAKHPAARPATMDHFSDMIAAVLQTLPADPNRSAGMSVQQGVVLPAVSSFQPSTPPPQGPVTPPGYYPPVSPLPTATIPARPRGNHRVPLYITLGVLALGGAGVAVWAATRDKPKTEQKTQVVEDRAEPVDAEDPWRQKDDTTDDTPAPAPQAAAPRPSHASVGTAMTAIPKGVRLKVPAGFVARPQQGALLYVNSNGQMIGLAPLYAGTNDPEKLAQMWTAETGFVKQADANVVSAGKSRDAMSFLKTLPDGSVVAELIVLYIEPSYRLGVVYQAPATAFADPAFMKQADAFFATGVILP